MKKICIIILLLILLLPCVLAKQGHMKLLAVKDTPSGYIGRKADLYLEIKPGKGRVFLDTRPLTKLDTQISTRFAKEIACSYIDFNCDKYDFIYTIKAESPIIGGPSAGAAVSILTIAVLKGWDIDENTSISGTINSGGLIGPVGSLKEKIDAAAKHGINKVLVPKGERFIPLEDISEIFKNLSRNVTNETLDLVEYGNKSGIIVQEVIDLGEALYEFSGEKIKEVRGELLVTEDYIETMSFLNDKLCNRSDALKKEMLKYEIPDDLVDMKKKAYNLTDKGRDSMEKKKYYSAASYCFGANVKLHQLILLAQNISRDKTLEKIEKIRKQIGNFSEVIKKKKKKTITDLEAYAIVKERLVEASDYLDKAEGMNNSEALSNLAYGIERLYSAYSWSYFFGKSGKQFSLDKESVKESCIEKLSEAEERYQYFTLFFPVTLVNRKELELAYTDLENGDYELCLFKASKAKASIDVVLSLFGAEDEQVKEILDQKLAVVKKNLIKEINKGIFPVIGYSYYEYANSLKEEDIYAALLYSEYALELSNLDIYFKRKTPDYGLKYEFNVYFSVAFIFTLGIIVGFLAGALYKRKKYKRKRAVRVVKKRKKRK